ncbi:ferredoxin reductase family protein [Marinimicrobium alkaliphilum]|uniref:ferredoxin reductase family protein n=1 Tax=Marinimicrobium alkaliphilum TaxID=2202654 RepID=UPI000DB90DC5|nr:ferredoxin reductase family protein [Marinimicrobium alkaliphilum]
MSPRMYKLLVWLIAILPGLVALFFMRSPDTASVGGVLNYLGRLTGIVGLSTMLMAAILCCRVPGFDRPFGGLTKMWKLHHQLGAVAFLLLLAHPLLLAFAAAEVSLTAAVATLTPTSQSLWLGWIALVLMMVFLAPSFAFFGHPDYQRWKWVHRLSGPAIILALIHTALLMRTLPAPWDTLVWVVYVAAAVGALAYRFVFSRVKGRQPYQVMQVERSANNVVEISLQAERSRLDHEAGQFVYLTPFDKTLTNGYAEEHPYTISSAPDEPLLRIAIKDLGDASRAIQTIAVGSQVKVEGPYGGFFPPTELGPSLWVAGGIGITPFLGKVRELARGEFSGDVHLVYCVQDESRALFLEELSGYAQALPGFHLSMHYFYREGPLDEAFLNRVCDDVAEREAFICGPTPLLSCARNVLLGAGVPARRITTEEFELL